MATTEFGRHATDSATAPAEASWFACYTRSRHEKRVSELLLRRGIESYVPLHARMEQWTDRKRRVLWPMFPSYVFVRFVTRELSRVVEVRGVVAVVHAGSVPAVISDEEIDNVRRFAAAVDLGGLDLELEPCVAVGERVLVTSGPLRGVEGVVVQRRGRARVVVGLQAVGQGLSVELETASVQRVGVAAAW